MGYFYIRMVHEILMKSPKSIFVNQKGMVVIPVELRKKYNLTPGTEVAIVELEGVLTIIPIRDIALNNDITLKAMAEIYEKSREDELKLE